MYLTRRLGVIPAAIPIGIAALETAWAWYDPDVFMDMWWEADQEQQVAMLNNQWVALERTATATLPYNHVDFDALRSTIDQWNAWKGQYHDAVLRRWIPLVGRDWDDELMRWFETFKRESAVIAKAGGEAAKERLRREGYDPDRLPERDKGIIEEIEDAGQGLIERAGEEARGVVDDAGDVGGDVGKGLLWPALALGVSAGIVFWLASSRSKRRVSA